MPKCKGCDIEYSQSIFTSPCYCKRCLDELEGELIGAGDLMLGFTIGFRCVLAAFIISVFIFILTV